MATSIPQCRQKRERICVVCEKPFMAENPAEKTHPGECRKQLAAQNVSFRLNKKTVWYMTRLAARLGLNRTQLLRLLLDEKGKSLDPPLEK